MNVYPPREDTYFLKKYLEGLEFEDKKVLEIGTGSGILAVTMAEKGASVTATDINPKALEETEERAEAAGVNVELVESDLFENIKERFDLIVFNPPYLPGEDEVEGNEKWQGGEKGTEVTERFARNLSKHLKDGGEAIFLVSSRSEYEELLDNFEVIDSENLWFEELYLVRGK